MNIILLSGGSGKRLWPLSNDIRSKQFIPLFPQENGQVFSMVQRVHDQLMRADSQVKITVATAKSQVSALKSQLGEQINISVEPCRRDTFPAIALVSAYLKDVKGLDENEVVAICPVDPYVDDSYFKAVARMTDWVASHEVNLMLMGIKPTYPSAKYGYIQPEESGEVSAVKAFKEKPDERTAAEYIAQGALWNGGVFACRLGYILRRAHELIEFAGYDDLYQNYARLPKISFDYAVVEKEHDIAMLRYDGDWKDIGTWNTLTEVMQGMTLGEVVMDDLCVNTHVVNETDMPVLCMGLKNLIVAASPMGVLVADKHQSSFIKPYVEEFRQLAKVAEKSWGKFQIIDIADNSLTIKVTLNPGHQMNYHSHEYRDENWTIIQGYGKARVDDRVIEVKTGDIISLPAGSKHSLIADSKLVAIEVQTGKDIRKSDKKKWD